MMYMYDIMHTYDDAFKICYYAYVNDAFKIFKHWKWLFFQKRNVQD